jgi:hypothetical protein
VHSLQKGIHPGDHELQIQNREKKCFEVLPAIKQEDAAWDHQKERKGFNLNHSPDAADEKKKKAETDRKIPREFAWSGWYGQKEIFFAPDKIKTDQGDKKTMGICIVSNPLRIEPLEIYTVKKSGGKCHGRDACHYSSVQRGYYSFYHFDPA